MKLKDIPKNALLSDYLLDFSPLNDYIDPPHRRKRGYIISFWNRGIWMKEKKTEVRIYPLCFNCEFEDIKDKILELEIIEK